MIFFGIEVLNLGHFGQVIVGNNASIIHEPLFYANHRQIQSLS